MAQEAHRRMGDYTDQLYRGNGFTFNMYYKCSANKTWDNPKGCCSVVRSDRWTQLLTCAQEAAGVPVSAGTAIVAHATRPPPTASASR
eukprot:5459115-Pyramimonas_sp.AAC.1